MHGRDIGALNIKINGTTVFTRSGENGNKWLADHVALTGNNTEVHFSDTNMHTVGNQRFQPSAAEKREVIQILVIFVLKGDL